MAATGALSSDDVFRNSLHPVILSATIALFTWLDCYFRLFVFPHVAVLPSGDQIGFAYAGSRIVAGQLPYRDYFQIVPPGTDLTYALLIRQFGLHTGTPHLVMTALASLAALLLTLISTRVLRGWVAALPALFMVGVVLPESLDATHHWFSTVAALAALLVLLGGTTFRRIAGAGAFCGLTACFTQTKGAAVLAGFAVYLVWKASYDAAPVRRWLRQCLALSAAAAGTFAIVNFHFISAAGVRQWLYCMIVYPLLYYPSPALNNWRVLAIDFSGHGGISRWVSYPFVYATVPLACIVFLVTTRRRWKDRTEPWPELVLIALTGVFMFLAIAPSPSMKRLGSVAPASMIPLVWMLSRQGNGRRLIRVGLSAVAIGMALAAPVRTQTRSHTYLDLPAGRTAFHDQIEYQEYAWILVHTHPGQFFFGTPMYLPFHLVNPAAIDGFAPSEYTRPEQVTALVQALEAHSVPLMILSSTKKYPLATGLPSDHLGSFRDYLYRNYCLAQTLATGDEVWRRNDTPTSCVPR